MATIRDKGIVTIALERDIKERIKQLAGDTDIYVFVRDMVNEYAERNPQTPMPVGSPIHSRDVEIPQGAASAVKSMAWVLYSLLDDSAHTPARNKALHDLWDRSVKELSNTRFGTNAEQGRLLNESP